MGRNKNRFITIILGAVTAIVGTSIAQAQSGGGGAGSAGGGTAGTAGVGGAAGGIGGASGGAAGVSIGAGSAGASTGLGTASGASSLPGGANSPGSDAFGGIGTQPGRATTGPGTTGMPGMGVSPQEAPSGGPSGTRRGIGSTRSGLGGSFGSAGGGGRRMGRGVGVMPGSVERNPAETLLREMGGRNATRRRGQEMVREWQMRKPGYRGTMPHLRGDALVFKRRGAYEEAIYGSRPGSYSMASGRNRSSQTRTR